MDGKPRPINPYKALRELERRLDNVEQRVQNIEAQADVVRVRREEEDEQQQRA